MLILDVFPGISSLLTERKATLSRVWLVIKHLTASKRWKKRPSLEMKQTGIAFPWGLCKEEFWDLYKTAFSPFVLPWSSAPSCSAVQEDYRKASYAERNVLLPAHIRYMCVLVSVRVTAPFTLNHRDREYVFKASWKWSRNTKYFHTRWNVA